MKKYDLKGSWIARGGNLDVTKLGKDNDLHKNIMVGTVMKDKLMDTLRRDTQLLRDLNIMDYSLFLGIKRNTREKEIVEEDESQSLILKLSSSDNSDLESQPSIHYLEPTDTEELGSLAVVISEDLEYIYAFGIIDVLQEYNNDKIQERCIKVTFLGKEEEGISCVEPQFYNERFLKAMDEILV